VITRQRDIRDFPVDALVQRFTAIAVQQYDCVQRNDVSRFNKLFQQMKEVSDELRSRPGDARIALVPLYTHSNLQVRLKAAIHTLAINRDAARYVLEEIAKDTFYVQALDAGFALQNMDRGIFKPT
jgi:hypothetical protein